jgi:hemerythrin-like domain-containing protein
MSGPFHLLKHDHRIIERGLKALDGACLRLETGNQIPASDLSQMIDFISTFADSYHHGKEEIILFPVLVRAGIQYQGGPLGAMEREHQIERRLMGNLKNAAEEYGQGNAEACSRFIEAARAYTHLMVGHLEREDSVLFPIAEALLNDDEKKALIAEFIKADDRFGTTRLTELESTAVKLEDDWAF